MKIFDNVRESLLGDVIEKKENTLLEKRYGSEPYYEPKKTEEARKRILESGMKNLESMRKTKNRPKAMAYFEKIALGQREPEIANSQKKKIGYFCSFIPEEFIYAAGAIPIRLCTGSVETMDIAEGILPRDVCPLVKSAFGFKILELSYMSLCDVVVVPASCDAKKKMAYMLADYMPIWVLNLPNKKEGDKSKRLWEGEMRDLKDNIEELTGNKITRKNLAESTKMLRKRTSIFRRLLELRKADPVPLSEKDFLLVIYASFVDDAKRWMENVSLLCDELDQIVKAGKGICVKGTPRLLLTGSPIIWPNYKILDIVEKTGMTIAVDQTCAGTWHLYEPVEVEENSMKGLLEAIAERYLLPSVCPCFTANDDRYDNLTDLIKTYDVDGVLYHVLRLCQLFDIEAETVKHMLEKANIPMLKIVTDYSKEDVGQLGTRVEAFKEMILIRGNKNILGDVQNPFTKKVVQQENAQNQPTEEAVLEQEAEQNQPTEKPVQQENAQNQPTEEATEK